MVHSVPQRLPSPHAHLATAALFALSASVTGVFVGTVLGFIGSRLPDSIRLAASSVLGIVAVGIAITELSGHRVRPIQCNRETPKNWVTAGPLRWAIRNGSALGCGATTRIGYWLWYVIPVSSLLIGDEPSGAALYGLYGASRGLALWVMLFGLPFRIQDQDSGLWLIQHQDVARLIAASQLLINGLVVTVIVGL